MKKDGLEIRYGVHLTPLGSCLVAILKNDICAVAFVDMKDKARTEKQTLAQLRKKWPDVSFAKDANKTAPFVKKIFDNKKGNTPLGLIVKGTDFQMKVWEQLIQIPKGETRTYAEVAKKIGRPKAVRAVGTACGKNDISVLIPCHRVLTSEGGLGGYRWGLERKKALLEQELVGTK